MRQGGHRVIILRIGGRTPARASYTREGDLKCNKRSVIRDGDMRGKPTVQGGVGQCGDIFVAVYTLLLQRWDPSRTKQRAKMYTKGVVEIDVRRWEGM